MTRPILALNDSDGDVLYKPSVRVKEKNASLEKLISDMIETMYAAKGIGISAVQVRVLQKVFVMDIPNSTKGPLVFINPVIEKFSTDLSREEEGCLSIPNLRMNITRARSVLVAYWDENFQPKKLVAEGIQAICIQHEFDHLNGILILSRVSKGDRKRVVQELVDCGYPVDLAKIGNLAR